jgi:hypothetical protein
MTLGIRILSQQLNIAELNMSAYKSTEPYDGYKEQLTAHIAGLKKDIAMLKAAAWARKASQQNEIVTAIDALAGIPGTYGPLNITEEDALEALQEANS